MTEIDVTIRKTTEINVIIRGMSNIISDALTIDKTDITIDQTDITIDQTVI